MRRSRRDRAPRRGWPARTAARRRRSRPCPSREGTRAEAPTANRISGFRARAGRDRGEQKPADAQPQEQYVRRCERRRHAEARQRRIHRRDEHHRQRGDVSERDRLAIGKSPGVCVHDLGPSQRRGFVARGFVRWSPVSAVCRPRLRTEAAYAPNRAIVSAVRLDDSLAIAAPIVGGQLGELVDDTRTSAGAFRNRFRVAAVGPATAACVCLISIGRSVAVSRMLMNRGPNQRSASRMPS